MRTLLLVAVVLAGATVIGALIGAAVSRTLSALDEYEITLTEDE